MTVRLQHPDSADPIDVEDDDADKYKASGWTVVQDKPDSEPKAPKKSV